MLAKTTKSSTAIPRETSSFFMVPPILVRLVIIFSETPIGLCALNVANPSFAEVTKSVTKSVTFLVRANAMEEHSFGRWLKLRRKALDLTREELAKRAGYSAATIRKIEDEERLPSVQVAERLAELFHIPNDEQTAFLRFARGDWRSAPKEREEDRPWQTPTKSTRSNLPAIVTSLI